MKGDLSRREFVSRSAVLPFAANAALADTSPPIIDTHMHLFDKTRPEGAPYPPAVPGGGEPPQGMISLPNRYKAIVTPLGVVGAIVVEASPRLEDNQWILDQAANAPIIVGYVGRLDPADPAFGANLARFRQNKLFLGIRQGHLDLGLDKPDYIANLALLANADCSLDVDTPRHGGSDPEVVVKVLDKVPSLRVVMDHLPDVPYPAQFFADSASKNSYVAHLKELGKRPQVYIKLSEVVHKSGEKVSTDLAMYKDWLDELWSIFGEDRVMFGSDWPQSEALEFNSYPNVIRIARSTFRPKDQKRWRRCSGRIP
jgi:L-fuconolactonase